AAVGTECLGVDDIDGTGPVVEHIAHGGSPKTPGLPFGETPAGCVRHRPVVGLMEPYANARWRHLQKAPGYSGEPSGYCWMAVTKATPGTKAVSPFVPAPGRTRYWCVAGKSTSPQSMIDARNSSTSSASNTWSPSSANACSSCAISSACVSSTSSSYLEVDRNQKLDPSITISWTRRGVASSKDGLSSLEGPQRSGAAK